MDFGFIQPRVPSEGFDFRNEDSEDAYIFVISLAYTIRCSVK